MTTFDQVLKLARELPLTDQARLRAALLEAEEAARAAQIARNQAALAMLDAWSEATEADDGSESWDAMLQQLDAERESTRKLYPDRHTQATERTW
ncbi:MAG: hypothetical protein EOM24_33455 [Chloroflexia bacterium]|nr:hypothetical protein [Chloroflexia bacterium]